MKIKVGLHRNSVEKIKFSRRRSASTPLTVSKVIEQINVKDPPTQRAIAQSCRVSQSTVCTIIKSTNFTRRKKRKAHRLTTSTVEKRHKRAFRFCRQLVTYSYKNFVTTDESWFYLDGTEGKQKVCYIKETDSNYDRIILKQDSSRPKEFMVWAGIPYREKTSMRFVETGAKINSDYYINHIVKPFLSRDLLRLFPGGQKRRMIYHHDNVPSHTSK